MLRGWQVLCLVTLLEESVCRGDQATVVAVETPDALNGFDIAIEQNDISTDATLLGVANNKTLLAEPTPLECGIWLAPSAIENAGLGMFAGRDFKQGELMQVVGDLAIPIVDLKMHNQEESFDFLWDEYTWSAAALGVEYEGFHDINGASPGFGSAANSFLPVVNVEELTPRRDGAGLHRSKDPGAGAFSPYYDRGSMAERDISAGEELYVSYGENWFKSRDKLGPIPLTKDLDKATWLARKFQSLQQRFASKLPASIFDELWDTFVRNTAFNTSRVIGGFHHDDPEEMDLLKSLSVGQLRQKQATRDQAWLEEFGTCGDHIYGGRSTIEQAGHGGFASRDLPEGTVVAQLPLIHITERRRLNMYKFDKEKTEIPNPEEGERPPQIMLNYCYGHNESTLLLCPYGPMVNFVNHNQTLANVKIVWADPARGNFMPHLLNGSLKELEDDATAKLAFEFVATRFIEKDEEIFVDYGDAWEQAWQSHVENWTPVEGAADYQSADDLNKLLELGEIPLPTEFERLEKGLPDFPSNVQLACNNYFSDDLWRPEFEDGTLDEALQEYEEELWYCYILSTTVDEKMGDVLYTIEARNDDDTHSKIWKDVPRKVFEFLGRPYTTDILLENAFRHAIGIPDDMFPDAWRNLSPDYEEEEQATDEEEEEEENEDM